MIFFVVVIRRKKELILIIGVGYLVALKWLQQLLFKLLSFTLQGSVHLYDSEGSVTDLFDVHNSEFVGVGCLTAGNQYCVVRQEFFSINRT